MGRNELIFVASLLVAGVVLLASEPAFMVGLAVALAAFSVLWLVSLALRNASIVDIFWGPGFVLLGWLYHLLSLAAHRPRPAGLRPGHGVGAAARRPHRGAQRRRRRGLSLPAMARAQRPRFLVGVPVQGLPAPGGRAVGRVVAPVARPAIGSGLRRPLADPDRARTVDTRLRFRGRVRLAAARLQARPGQPRPGARHRPVGPQPAPQLLRRGGAVVGDRADRGGRRPARSRSSARRCSASRSSGSRGSPCSTASWSRAGPATPSTSRAPRPFCRSGSADAP